MQGPPHPRGDRYGRPAPTGRVYGARDDGTARREGVARDRRSGESPARARARARQEAAQVPRQRGQRPPSQRKPDPRKTDPRKTDPRKPDPRKNGRRRTPIWATLTVVFGAVLMMLSGGTLAAAEWAKARYAGNVQQENLLGGAAAEPGEELAGPINMLLLGIDARSDQHDEEKDVRSDTIIVLHVPSTHDQAYLMSVPRDTLVTPPGYWDMKITEAFQQGYVDRGGWQGGAALVAETLNQATGLRFNGAAIINFGGFRKIIDEMGGIEFCVEVAATSEHMVLVDGEPMGIGRAQREGYWNYEQVRYEQGCQSMAGWQALDYVRQRKQLETEEGDYARQRHQQQLIQAMAKQAASSDVRTNLGTLDGLLLAAGDAVIMDTNGVDMVDFLFTMRDVRPGDLVSLQTNGGWFNSTQIGGKSYELLAPESVQMFQAAANDTMGEFVIQHPDFVNSD